MHRCKLCGHDHDSHDFEQANPDDFRAVACTGCPDGWCRPVRKPRPAPKLVKS